MDECRAAVVVSHNEPLEIQKVPIPELEPLEQVNEALQAMARYEIVKGVIHFNQGTRGQTLDL